MLARPLTPVSDVSPHDLSRRRDPQRWSSSGQDVGALWRATTELVGAANEVVARHAALRRQWRLKDAQRARDRLCEVLRIAVDERLWAGVREVVRGEPDAMLLEGLRALDLGAFAELERELYEAAPCRSGARRHLVGGDHDVCSMPIFSAISSIEMPGCCVT